MLSYRIRIAVLLLIVLEGCSENVKFTQKDLSNHPWLASFTPKVVEFDGTHDIDNGKLDASFTSELEMQDYFYFIDSLSQAEGWEKTFAANGERIFTKNIPYLSDEPDTVIVKVSYLESKRISLKVR
jgi:hypothetical protein